MIVHPEAKPKLRPLEPFATDEPGMIGVRDPAGLSNMVISLSEPAFLIMTMLDGKRTLADVQQEFLRQVGQPLEFDTLAQMVSRLDESLMLDSPRFEAHHRRLVEEYRAAPARTVCDPATLGLEEGGDVAFEQMLGSAAVPELPGPIVGLVVPHLDYPRGAPCYGAGYAALRKQEPPDRVVVLGTNHFGTGNGDGVVATGQPFETPLGLSRCDTAFLERLERDCGDLRRYEYDHVAEHSVELQVCLLQYIFGPDRFSIVPFLCPDPCGPTGTKPYNGDGIDLADFARSLRNLVAEDGASTLIVAGADFSHVGMFFGDARELDEEFLTEVRRRDEQALERLLNADAEQFRRCVAEGENPTRICSAGCMYVIKTALPEAQTVQLGYHQAVTESAQNCVSCAAVALCR